MPGLPHRFRRALAIAGTAVFALAASSLLLPLAGCDKHAVDPVAEDRSWKVSPRVFAGDLTEDELRRADWVRVEASRSGTVIAYAETLFSARSVNLTIPTPGAVSIAISGYDDRSRATLLWRGASNVESGTRDPIVTLAKMPGLIPVPKPRFSIDSGVFRGTVKVAIAADSSDLSIHYTTDGGDPSASSPRYVDSIVVDRSTVLSAVAYRKGRALSEIVRASIQVKRDTLPAPRFGESAGEYARILQVSLLCDTAGARIHYTTDGSDPDLASPVYREPIRVASDTRIKAFAAKPGLVSSGIRSVEYVIRLPKLAPPRFTPASGRFDSARMISLAADSGATIRYTTVQGETPDSTSGRIYSSAILVERTTTISAMATMEGRASSEVAIGTFVIVPPGTVAAPWAEPAGGTYRKTQSVVLKADSGATVRYTLNGTDPDASSPVYSAPIPMDRDLTIKAVATKSGLAASSVFTALYRLRPDTVALVRLAPDGRDIYEAGQKVSLLCDTSDAEIRYTLDGTVPTLSSPRYVDPISLDSSAMLRAIAFKTDLVPSAMTEAYFEVRRAGALPDPQIRPQGGVFSDSQAVTLVCDTSDAQIRYTLDGSTPTERSSLYQAPFVLRSSAPVKAIAFKSGRIPSGIAGADFTINVAGKAETPRFSLNGGEFPTARQIVIYTLDTTLAIRYTTDGSDPSSASDPYTEPVLISATTTLKAVAFKEGLTPSDVKEARFTVTAKAPDTLESPRIGPDGGTFTDVAKVGLSAAADARIHYTLDGREPDESSALYTDSLFLDTSRTVKAIACRTGSVCSKTSFADFTIVRREVVATPEIGPKGGTYSSAQSVAIECATNGATLRYTLDGTNPGETSPSYDAPIAIASSATLRVVGFRDGMAPSKIAEETFVILRKTASPVFSRSGKDTLRSATKLGLSSGTPGARLFYTVDGSEPDSGKNPYMDSLTLAASQTVKAIAYAPGMQPSDVASMDYVYAELGTIQAPTITPSGVLFVGTQNVQITSWGPSQSTTWYTTDGTDPATSATRKTYSTSFVVSSTTTVRAYTEAPGMKDSPVRSATLTLTTQVAAPAITPPAGTYSTSQPVTLSCATAGATIHYTLDGTTPTTSSSVYSSATPITLASSATVSAIAVASGKIPSEVVTSKVTILPKLAVPTISVKTGTYTTIQKVVLGHSLAGTTIRYTLDGSTPTSSSSIYSDTVVVSSTQTITAMAEKSGYANSGTSSVTLTINLPKIDTLTYSLAAGTYTGNQVVTITSPVAGATIYYTTDGNNPTTRSSVYSGKGLTLSANTTLKAIAVKTGYTSSDVKLRTYNIRCWAPTFDTTAGTYTSTKSITISSATSGTTIYYTIDGTVPSSTNGKPYTTPVTVSYSQTLRAVAVKTGLTNSFVASAAYTISPSLLSTQPAAATFSPNGGTGLTSSIKVTLSAATGATIFYTTDWSEPTKASPIYEGPISVTETTTIKARVFLNGYYSPVSGRNFVY